MRIIQVVRSGVVADAIIVDAQAVVTAERIELSDGADITSKDGSTFYEVEGAAIGWLVEGGTLVPPPAPTMPAVDLVAYAADARWRKEVGGIAVNGKIIDTSRESQNMIAGADALAQADPEEVVAYKTASGWIEVDAATIHEIALAVGRHVRGLFKLERQVAAEIDEGTITTIAEIDTAFSA